MSSALVSPYYADRHPFDNQNKMFMNRSCLPNSSMSMGNSYEIQKPSPSPPVNMVNHFPRARGFSTSAINTSSTAASHISVSGKSSAPSMPYMLNMNAIGDSVMVNREGLRRMDRSLSVNDASDIRNNRNNQTVNSSRYKTELCRPFEENGHCKYGEKCQFAHGMQELRNLARHPKYKTELCRTYHTVGFCPYGPRCHFVHNEEEAKKQNQHPSLNTADNVSHVPCVQAAPPLRPTLPNRNTAYNPLSISLVSSAESSAPSSLSGSPSISPTFFEDVASLSSSCSSNSSTSSYSSSSSSYTGCSPPGFSPSAPCPVDSFPPTTTASTIFNFAALSNELTKIYTPLDIHTSQNTALDVLAMNRINNGTTIMDSTTCLRDDVFSAPPSPPDSVSEEPVVGSPMDRLPIFRRLSLEEMLAAQ